MDLLLQIIDDPEFEGGGLYCRHVLNFPNPNVFQDEKNGPRNKSLFVQCDPPPVISWFISPSNYSCKYHKP